MTDKPAQPNPPPPGPACADTSCGRLYWSDAQYARDCENAQRFRCSSTNAVTMIGRLSDGREVEYNQLVSAGYDDYEPGDGWRFLGYGRYVGPCRFARYEPPPVEAQEIALLKSPFVPEEVKRDPERLARVAWLTNFQDSGGREKPL